MADKLADLGVQKHGVRMRGQEQQTPNRQAEWARDRGDQELGSQGLAPQVAATDGEPSARVEQPHAGRGVQRLMFVTYVDIDDQRRDEGPRYALFLAHRTGALALRSAEEEDRRQLLSQMPYNRRQGLQWEWYRSCKGMLEGWGAERHRLELQALENQGRQAPESEACIRQEPYSRYDLARQCYWGQRQLQWVAKGLAQWVGQLSLECKWRDRVVQEEH